MSITGEPAHGPTRAGFAICDTIGGMTAALAVASALFQRTHTGRGQLVDVAMLDAALAFIPGPVSEYTVAGIEQRQIGNGSVSRKPTASRFRTRDGYIVLAVLTEKQFVSLMRALGPRRRARRPALQGLAVAHRERARPARDHRDGPGHRRRAGVGGAAHRRRRARVARSGRSTRSSSHPQLEHREVLQTIDSRYGPMRLVGAGFRLAHGSPGLDREPPTLGEHTDEVLKEAGYGADEIAGFRRSGAI